MNVRTSVAAVSLTFLLACTGLFSKGPWQGDARFTALLTADAPAADVDATVFTKRLEALGVTVDVTQHSSKRLQLDISDARGPEVLDQVLPRYDLEISSPHGALGNEHVASATPDLDDFIGYPLVQVVLTEEGGRAFCELSKAGVGEVVTIAVDGEVLSAPIVREPICGGRLQISLSHEASLDDALEQAQALATGLGTAPLSTTWTLETLDLK